MATRRMVPTRFFKDPDIMNLQSRDTQLILLGLILLADDEGRELAHSALIGRELDYPPEQIETALQDLAANDLLVLYQVGRHRYYSLTRWRQWQTMGSKMTPSKYPAPPLTTSEQTPSGREPEENADPRTFSDFSGVSPENSGKSWESSPQSNLIESNLREEERPQSVVIPFRPSRVNTLGPDQNNQQVRAREQRIKHITGQVASNLKLAITPALTRLIEEFLDDPGLCLPGEADAARSWIDDQTRNKKQQSMTLTFFRRWLKREREQVAQRRRETSPAFQATGTLHRVPLASSMSPPSQNFAQSRSLMHLEREYHSLHSSREKARQRKED